MMRIPRLALSLALGAALVAGCDRSPLSPGELAGRYVLVSVNGAPLPAVALQSPDVTTEVLADTFQLNADGTGLDSRLDRLTTHADGVTFEQRSSQAMTFREAGGRLELVYHCSTDPSVLCLSVAPSTAERTADGLLVHMFEKDLAFRRID